MIRNVLETLTLWSGWRDSNSRHPAPKAGALPDCAIPRMPQQHCLTFEQKYYLTLTLRSTEFLKKSNYNQSSTKDR